MPVYNYQCLYCGNCDLSLAGLNDHMTLCSQCGSLMVRLDDDFFWQLFDKNHFQFTGMANCPPAPTTGADTFGGKISIRLNSGQYRFSQLTKWTPRANMPLRRASPLLLACKAIIFCDKKLGRGEPDPQKPKSLWYLGIQLIKGRMLLQKSVDAHLGGLAPWRIEPAPPIGDPPTVWQAGGGNNQKIRRFLDILASKEDTRPFPEPCVRGGEL